MAKKEIGFTYKPQARKLISLSYSDNNVTESATLSAAIGSYDYSVYLYYMGAILAVAIPGLSLATVEAVLLNYE